MKIFALLLTSVISVMAQIVIVKYAPSYEAALQQAEKENKLVMVMLSKEDCDACWYMENVVFDDDGITHKIMDHFVPVHLDIHRDILQGLEYIGTPTFYFLKPDETQLKRLDGAANVKDFGALLDSMI